MKRQKNMFQTKAKDKSSEEVQNEVEIHNLLDIEFKEMITKIPNEVRRIINKQSMLAELGNIKKTRDTKLKFKNTIEE